MNSAALVVGASGATGKHLVEHLLEMGHNVKVIVRSGATIPDAWTKNDHVAVITGSITAMSVSELTDHVKDCDAVASCLGHNLTLKGIYGKPRRLVTDAVRLLSEAVIRNAPAKPVKMVLMNTAGNRNRDLNEPVSVGERLVITLLRLLLPPHPDNEQAADFLRLKIGRKNKFIEWAVVRPDTLIDQKETSEYELHVSPTRSALFNPGKTSRVNVGHVMATLITDRDLWNTWKGQMPVVYNKGT